VLGAGCRPSPASQRLGTLSRTREGKYGRCSAPGSELLSTRHPGTPAYGMSTTLCICTDIRQGGPSSMTAATVSA
jgi:hypothetical protein